MNFFEITVEAAKLWAMGHLPGILLLLVFIGAIYLAFMAGTIRTGAIYKSVFKNHLPEVQKEEFEKLEQENINLKTENKELRLKNRRYFNLIQTNHQNRIKVLGRTE
jgi:cell division protein FtsB